MSEFKIAKEKTAIVLIEPQNDFLSEGGTMYAFIKEQLAERNVIANLQDLLERARGQVAKIFYVPFHSFEEGFPELKKGGPAYEGLRGIEIDMVADWGKGAWLRGTPGPEIIPQLTPKREILLSKARKHWMPSILPHLITCFVRMRLRTLYLLVFIRIGAWSPAHAPLMIRGIV